MSMWQNIFAVKIEEMHVTDPWTLLEDDALQVQACKPGWKEFVQRRAPGRFQCSQCFYNWSSAKVHIMFHMYHCPGWGTVWMRIFRQKCRHCPNSRLEDPQFSPDTVETILHNLVIKILQYFYKKPVQPSDLLEVVVDRPVTGPHDHAHCEACELGICNRSQRALALDAWKPLMDEDKARMHSSKPWVAWPSDVWKSLTNTGEAEAHHTEPWSSLGSDDCKPLVGVDKARTHRTKLKSAPTQVARSKTKTMTSQTLKHQGLRPHEASTYHPSPFNSNSRPHEASAHHPSPSNRNFSWKWCCCIGSSLLCVLALIIFIVLYLTIM